MEIAEVLRRMNEEKPDHEVGMAKSSLTNIDKNLNELHGIMKELQDSDQLEAWVQAKITKANEYIEAITNHLRTKRS